MALGTALAPSWGACLHGLPPDQALLSGAGTGKEPLFTRSLHAFGRRNPEIFLVHDFFSHKQCERLVQKALLAPEMHPAGVAGLP